MDLPDRLNVELSGRYRLSGEAAAGGMATVYRARDLRHARDVAIKVLRRELAAAIGAERFHTEIATTAGLQHPNILPLFDSGEAAGCLFYVMPYVEGPSLRGRLERERQLPVDDAVALTCTVAAALAHAHRHGVIHRDIKPDNILLSHGVPVLADFGIATVAPEPDVTRLTQAGMAIGTVAYMSPEQATGASQADARSDIYSLACVLYEALSGQLPHAGPNAYAIVGRRLTEPPAPIRELRAAVPSYVDSALRRALAIAPGDRFATVEAFAAALRPPTPRLASGAMIFLRAEPRSYGVLMHEGEDEALRLAREQARALVESVIESSGGVLHAAPAGAVGGGFVGAEACVRAATTARDAVARFNARRPAAERVHYRFGVAEAGRGSLDQASELAWSATSDGIQVSEPLRDTLAPSADETGARPNASSRPLPPQLEALDIPPPAQPSIAIMPFTCPEGDAEGEELAEGLRIDITNALMKMGRIFLVAPSSMNKFRGAPGSETARRVGTRHVLEGAIRRSGDRVRVAMQLTDTGIDGLVWSERYDRVLDDAFALEDEIAARVITELDVRLSMGEQARLWRKCLTHPAAREHYYRGLGYFFQSTSDSVAAARSEFERVARIVPESPVGATWTALALWIQATHGWDAEASRLAVEWARRAAEMPDADGQAHTVLGATLLLEQRWDEAILIARDSVRIRPGCNTANGILANVLLHCGDYEGAICHAKRAMRIGPIYPPWFLEILSSSHRESGQLELAVTVAREIIRLAPESVSGRVVLASALVRAGWVEEARQVVREVPRLEPGFAVDAYLANQPFRSVAVKERLGADLRVAGLPAAAPAS